METIGVYEAKTHLPKLIERVRKGAQITITKHGVPVAILHAPPATVKADPETVIAEIRRFRRKLKLDGLSLRNLIDEGRR